MNKIFLSKRLSSRISRGHDWIFDYEIALVDGKSGRGDLVRVFTHTGSLLGIGLYNPEAKIAVRILKRYTEELDFETHFDDLLSRAMITRTNLNLDTNIFRLFHSESDGLSGIYIDHYPQHIVVQLLTYGLESRKEAIRRVIESRLGKAYTIFFDDSNTLRRYEHLKVAEEVRQPFELSFNGYQLWYKSRHSFSIERREVYGLIRTLSRDKTVWDLCCGTGHFSFNAVMGGASEVLAVDNNDSFLLDVQSVIDLNNNMRSVSCINSNVFDFLKGHHDDLPMPDIIILDLPVFNVSDDGLSPYKELILRSFRRLLPGSFLVVGYQSARISPLSFENMIAEAATDAKKDWVIHLKVQNPPDQPVHKIYEHSNSLHFWMIGIR